MPAPSAALRQRAFVAARGRVRTLNTAGAFKRRFRDAPTPRKARVVSAGLVALDGTIYPAALSSGAANAQQSIYVINGGRPAAASYIQTTESGETKA